MKVLEIIFLVLTFAILSTFLQNLYTDVTLACDGKLYSVHKLVLSTCSDYFSSMLERTNCKNPVIVLKDIKSEDLEALLDYMYLGEVNVRQSDLATLIKAAECLRVKGLAVPDDEPPPKKTRSGDTQSRRGDTSSSPPAKRKRRSDVDDGRDDVRNAPRSPRVSPISKPKTSSHFQNSHSSSSSLKNLSSNNGVSNSETNDDNKKSLDAAPSDNISNISKDGDDISEIVPRVKMEVEDEGQSMDGPNSNSGDVGDSFNIGNDDFKEEGDDGELGTDLPEFLQEAANNYPHTSFAGPSYQTVSFSCVKFSC